MASDYQKLPFSEAIAFFRQKRNISTRAWTDIYAGEHDHSFAVAGAMKTEMLADFRAAIDKAISEGTTLEAFRKDFDVIVNRYGWSYKGGRGWRTRVIYETNVRQSYNAGREAQLNDPDLRKSRPYGLYRHGDTLNPRPQHLAWDGLVIPLDDPWWDTHTPQNGWGCKCKKFAVGESDLKRMGKSAPDRPPPVRMIEKTVGIRGPSPRRVRVPEGIDPGFEYRPGASWIRNMTPPPLDDLLPPAGQALSRDKPDMPAPRPAPSSRILSANLDDQVYVDLFLREFGIEAPDKAALYKDVAGEYLLISDWLFREFDGTLKIDKRGRAPYMLLMADTIKSPDEIWEGWGQFGDKAVLRRRYVARWRIEGREEPVLSVFEAGPQGWAGVTSFRPDSIKNLDNRGRMGRRVYVRKE